MSSLTPLTATVVVLGLWCWVPTGAYNWHMRSCNRTTMPVVSPLNVEDFQGRWYQSHISYNSYRGYFPYGYNGVLMDIHIKNVPVNKRGEKSADFYLGETIWTTPNETLGCAKYPFVTEIIGDKFSDPYTTWRSNVYWYDSYVLATDYASTAVMLTELITNGAGDITSSQIKVFVRDPARPPDTKVVGKALMGFCQDDALDLSSDFYAQIPNNSSLTCFPQPEKTSSDEKLTPVSR